MLVYGEIFVGDFGQTFFDSVVNFRYQERVFVSQLFLGPKLDQGNWLGFCSFGQHSLRSVRFFLPAPRLFGLWSDFDCDGSFQFPVWIFGVWPKFSGSGKELDCFRQKFWTVFFVSNRDFSESIWLVLCRWGQNSLGRNSETRFLWFRSDFFRSSQIFSACGEIFLGTAWNFSVSYESFGDLCPIVSCKWGQNSLSPAFDQGNQLCFRQRDFSRFGRYFSESTKFWDSCKIFWNPIWLSPIRFLSVLSGRLIVLREEFWESGQTFFDSVVIFPISRKSFYVSHSEFFRPNQIISACAEIIWTQVKFFLGGHEIFQLPVKFLEFGFSALVFLNR